MQKRALDTTTMFVLTAVLAKEGKGTTSEIRTWIHEHHIPNASPEAIRSSLSRQVGRKLVRKKSIRAGAKKSGLRSATYAITKTGMSRLKDSWTIQQRLVNAAFPDGLRTQ